MKPRLFFFIIAVVISVSCSKHRLPTEVSLQDAFSLAAEKKDTIVLLVCDYRQYYQLWKNPRYRFIRKHMHKGTLLYTDISLPNNRTAQYIYEYKSMPAIMKITPDGYVYHIEYESGVDTIDQNVSAFMKLLLDGVIEITREEPRSEVFKCIERNTSLTDNILANYLLSEYFDKISEYDRSIKHRNHLLRAFENNPDRITEQLYIQTLKELNDSLPHITLNPASFSFSDFPSSSDTTVSVLVRNYGVHPFVMTDVRVSCSCLKVEYPRVIENGKIGTLSITLSSGEEKKEFEQEVVIGRALYGKSFVVSLKGNII